MIETIKRYCSRPPEGREHVTLRAAITVLRNVSASQCQHALLCATHLLRKCVRAV